MCVCFFGAGRGGCIVEKKRATVFTLEARAFMNLIFSPAIVHTDHVPSNMSDNCDGASALSQLTGWNIHRSRMHAHVALTQPLLAWAHSGQLLPACLARPHTPPEMMQAPLSHSDTLCCIRAGPPAHVLDADSQDFDGGDGVWVLRPQHPLIQLPRLAVQRLRLRGPVACPEGGEGMRRVKKQVYEGRVRRCRGQGGAERSECGGGPTRPHHSHPATQ